MLYRSPERVRCRYRRRGRPALGDALSFGGPYLGFMACTQALTRKLPGRIVGQTTDLDGKRCFVLTLQAREQHIRREKASSNVCSNQAHCALTASVYMATMGEEGMTKVAQQCRTKAHYAAQKISALPGFELVYPGEFFHEFCHPVPHFRRGAKHPSGRKRHFGWIASKGKPNSLVLHRNEHQGRN
ncbi:MAG: hypothetical protein ACOX0K_07875 [Oscillospiraceae bacterium]